MFCETDDRTVSQLSPETPVLPISLSVVRVQHWVLTLDSFYSESGGYYFSVLRSAVLLIPNIDVLYISQSATQNIKKKNNQSLKQLIGLVDWIHWTSDPVIYPSELTCILMRCIQVFEATPRKGHIKRPYNVHRSCKRLPQHRQTALPSPAGCLIHPTWSSFGQQPTECSMAPSFHKHTSRSLKYVTKSC